LIHNEQAVSGTVFARLKGTQNVTDGTVSARIALDYNNTGAWGGGGLYVRHDAGPNLNASGYLFWLQPDGGMNIAKGSWYGATNLGAFVTKVNMFKETAANYVPEVELSVVMAGNRFDVYVNSVWVFGFNDNDNPYLSGHVGIMAHNMNIDCYDFKVAE